MNDDVLELLAELRHFLDDFIDIEDSPTGYGEPGPNRAMSLANRIDDLLAAAGAHYKEF